MKTHCTLLSLFLLLLAGCGESGPELGQVTGTVSYHGHPLSQVEVTFNPEGEGTSSYGLTDDQGKYKLDFTRDRSGAMVGWSRVALSVPPLPQQTISRLKDQGVQVPKGMVPHAGRLRELTTSGLRFEVKPGANVIDIEIPIE